MLIGVRDKQGQRLAADEDLRRWQQLYPKDHDIAILRAWFYRKNGELDKAREILYDLLERSKELYISPYYLAALSVALGEIDQGFELLDQAYKDGDFWVRELKVDPLFEDVRSDPRYDTMLKKLRLK